MSEDAITPQASCADEFEPGTLSVEAARGQILQAVNAVSDRETVLLTQAVDKVLAVDVVSPMNVPGHTNSAMDGYAMRADDLPKEGVARLRVIGSAFAGEPFNGRVGEGECLRIMTGAQMPQGADTVVMQEQSETDGEGFVRFGSGHRRGQNVRQAGEDIAAGSTVLSAGRRLTAADVGVLASLGIAQVQVLRPVRVALFSTGNEVRSLDETLGEGEIYDSNRYSLQALLAGLGVEVIDLGVIPDDPDALKAAFQEGVAKADVVMTSGGVSVGEADYTKPVLRSLGDMQFWKIAMKPGRPLTFGKIEQSLFFGLPGNPVAVMVTFLQFVQPALLALSGESPRAPLILQARCLENIRKRPGRTEYPRAVMSLDEQGQLQVCTTGQQGSGILTSMSQANCLMILPDDCAGVKVGDAVQVQPFSTWFA